MKHLTLILATLTLMACGTQAQKIEKTPWYDTTTSDDDKKVKKPANVFAIIFGVISAVVMGSGMSLVMTDIGSIMTGDLIPSKLPVFLRALLTIFLLQSTTSTALPTA